jgi:hypothetical protein
MKKIAALFAIVQLAMFSSPAMAQDHDWQAGGHRSVTTQSWVEEWDPVQGRWVKIADDEVSVRDESLPTVVTTIVNGKKVTETRSAARYAEPASVSDASIALGQFGPLLVATPLVALMVGSTNSRSPQDFDAMLGRFPGIETIKMVEAPGTSNDIANLALGRKIREAGISTHVPRDGSVRSGAVELFLAGQSRTIDDGAEFAVHSWLDNHGREADDFAADHPAHRLYIDYYVEMGMSEAQARAFYSMTNSVPHASARWLEADEMRGWIAPREVPVQRHASLEAEMICDFCDRVNASLAAMNTHIGAMAIEPIVLNTAQPAIGYSDLTQVKLAWVGTSLLDS